MVVALAVLSAVSTAAAVWFYLRGRRRNEVSPEAVYKLLRAAPILQEGLTADAAGRVAQRLHDVLGCVAVGLADADGTLLSWEGGAAQHYADLAFDLDAACRTGHRRLVAHSQLPCPDGRSCGMRAAVVVPLVVDGETAAALIVVVDSHSRQAMAHAEAVARIVGVQLELAGLEEAKAERQTAEINALRAQMSPHFVFNALTAIAELIRKDPDEARELLMDFADFCRYSFRAPGTYTTLAEEFRNIDRYLTIENAVRGGKLTVRMKVAPEVLSVVVPYLTVQPLVENAVRHGLSRRPRGGTVTIIAEDAGAEAVVSVEDDGVGMDPRQLQEVTRHLKAGSHVGLGNVNHRMRSIFGENHALTVETAPGAGTKVILRVPKFNLGARPRLNLPDEP
ncbi:MULTISPECIES: histidine kinase [Amycolatopsis]|uniref:Histidine kinase n=1 Tax=Amycolatopsis albidoflavus TaxID=102226 RepID=A0ABW5I3J0_9PSEU